jgi:menaquinone-specific isochorismate synthase
LFTAGGSVFGFWPEAQPAAIVPPRTEPKPKHWRLRLTDIEATLPSGVTSLEVVGAIHPSAAVAGSPTPLALEIIRQLEPFDRGRYAGPVGWMDASGDGEWSIALRCAQWSPEGTITAYAGAGIVADSEPASELLETRLKFKPVLGAFGPHGD